MTAAGSCTGFFLYGFIYGVFSVYVVTGLIPALYKWCRYIQAKRKNRKG